MRSEQQTVSRRVKRAYRLSHQNCGLKSWARKQVAEKTIEATECEIWLRMKNSQK